MLTLITIRRQGTIAVLGRNLAVKVLLEKTARAESRDTTVDDGGLEGSPSDARRVGGCSLVAAPAEADLPRANSVGLVQQLPNPMEQPRNALVSPQLVALACCCTPSDRTIVRFCLNYRQHFEGSDRGRQS